MIPGLESKKEKGMLTDKKNSKTKKIYQKKLEKVSSSTHSIEHMRKDISSFLVVQYFIQA